MTLFVGVTVSTANPGYTAEEFSHSLSLSNAEIIFVYSDSALIKTALEACKIANIQPNIYLLPGADGGMEKGFKSWDELQGEANSGFKAVKLSEEELKTRIACTCTLSLAYLRQLMTTTQIYHSPLERPEKVKVSVYPIRTSLQSANKSTVPLKYSINP